MTLLVKIQSADGTWRKFKPVSKRRLKRKHDTGKCWWLCSYCDADMQDYVKNNPHEFVTNQIEGGES